MSALGVLDTCSRLNFGNKRILSNSYINPDVIALFQLTSAKCQLAHESKMLIIPCFHGYLLDDSVLPAIGRYSVSRSGKYKYILLSILVT